MNPFYEIDEAVDQLADEATAENMERREKIDAMAHAIDGLDDPLLRTILREILELI